jgi:hypothetical protein
MKKIFVIFFILTSTILFFGSEKTNVNNNNSFSVKASFGFKNYSLNFSDNHINFFADKNDSEEKKENTSSSDFMGTVAKNQKTFLTLGIAFSASAGGCLIVGITGGILIGVSSNVANVYGVVSGANTNIAGIILAGLGFGFFGLFMFAAIPMWVFYGLSFANNSKQSRLNMILSGDKIGLSIKL